MSNLLKNPSFEDSPTSSGDVISGKPGNNGPSAAPNWVVQNNVSKEEAEMKEVKTVTRIDSPSKHPEGGHQMLFVSTNYPRCGVFQIFPAHRKVLSSVLVYVIRGRVSMGTGNGGNTGGDVFSDTLDNNNWVMLQAPNGITPANEFCIYSFGEGGADFFVDLTSIEPLLNDTPIETLVVQFLLGGIRVDGGGKAVWHGGKVDIIPPRQPARDILSSLAIYELARAMQDRTEGAKLESAAMLAISEAARKQVLRSKQGNAGSEGP